MDRKKDKRLEEARRKGRKKGKTDVKENKNGAPLFIGTPFLRVGLYSSSFDKVERRLIYAEWIANKKDTKQQQHVLRM